MGRSEFVGSEVGEGARSWRLVSEMRRMVEGETRPWTKSAYAWT